MNRIDEAHSAPCQCVPAEYALQSKDDANANDTFVTNNRSDFLVLDGQEPLHAGVIIIVPSVAPVGQRGLFSAALEHIGARDLTNTVFEVDM